MQPTSRNESTHFKPNSLKSSTPKPHQVRPLDRTDSPPKVSPTSAQERSDAGLQKSREDRAATTHEPGRKGEARGHSSRPLAPSESVRAQRPLTVCCDQPPEPHALLMQITARSHATSAINTCAGSTPSPAANRSWMRSTANSPQKANTAARKYQSAFIALTPLAPH